jgi:hypothetical protein
VAKVTSVTIGALKGLFFSSRALDICATFNC